MFVRPGPGKPVDTPLYKTFIISGIGRGGTSLVAAVMQKAGLYLGEHLSKVVTEDLELHEILRSRNLSHLDALIVRRNAAHGNWGFKIPDIPVMMEYADLRRFRNPHLVLIFRDPLAIAQRSVIAEHFDPIGALQDAADALGKLARFVSLTACPALLISYEKALIDPPHFVDTLAAFCGFQLDEPRRSALLAEIIPNSPAYAESARRQYVGFVERIRDGFLQGWCMDAGQLASQQVDLFIGGDKILTANAGQFRQDLLEAGFGNGNHGFLIDLRAHVLDPASILEVRIARREFILQGSGHALSYYQQP